MLLNPSILTNVRFTEAVRRMEESMVGDNYAQVEEIYGELFEVAQGLLRRCESSGHTDNTELMQRARTLLD